MDASGNMAQCTSMACECVRLLESNTGVMWMLVALGVWAVIATMAILFDWRQR